MSEEPYFQYEKGLSEMENEKEIAWNAYGANMEPHMTCDYSMFSAGYDARNEEIETLKEQLAKEVTENSKLKELLKDADDIIGWTTSGTDVHNWKSKYANALKERG